MASQNTLNTYDAYSRITEFKGLNQYGDGINSDARYATECENMETPGGVLQPAAACVLLPPQLEQPIETLMRLYRRWYTGGEDKTYLVAASGGKLYAMHPNDTAWTEIEMPEGVAAFASNVWSWVTYEVNDVGSEAPTDVLLISNAVDGMFLVRGDTLKVTVVDAPKKFGVIERYAERIWGGASPDDPDILTYSAPFDPTDWIAVADDPAAGAGDVQQPSWDGDSFTALKSFGQQLIAFKKTRVWRVSNTDPSEYVFKEQYGGGTPFPNTIAVDVERIFMLDRRGVSVYDGLSVTEYQHDWAQKVYARMNQNALDQACACLWHSKYYLAIPIDGSETNNAVLIYDQSEATWLLRTDACVESFLPTDECLYFTSTQTPGKVWKWNEDSWVSGSVSGAKTLWATPWNDLRYKNVLCGNFAVYLLAETQTSGAEIRITLQTERRKVTKTIRLMQENRNGKEPKQIVVPFPIYGRRFRLIIESENCLWRINSGVMITSDIAED